MNENIFNLDPGDRCLKTSEVATMLGMSEKTLKTYRADGLGPAFVKFKGLVRYRLSDVKKWRDNPSTKRYACAVFAISGIVFAACGFGPDIVGIFIAAAVGENIASVFEKGTKNGK